MRALFLAALLICSCGAVADDPAGFGAAGENQTNPRFVGHWFVQEEVARGGWSAVVYELRVDGVVRRGQGVEYSGSIDALGRVQKPGSSLGCGFGPRWWSQSDDVLVVTGECSDGIERAIAIEFVTAPAQNAAGASIEIRSVGGESGWTRSSRWGWKMQKCRDAADCDQKLR